VQTGHPKAVESKTEDIPRFEDEHSGSAHLRLKQANTERVFVVKEKIGGREPLTENGRGPEQRVEHLFVGPPCLVSGTVEARPGPAPVGQPAAQPADPGKERAGLRGHEPVPADPLEPGQEIPSGIEPDARQGHRRVHAERREAPQNEIIAPASTAQPRPPIR
jgi:hypothetical protein